MPKAEKVNADTGEVAEVEVDAASLAKETLTGDLRDIMLRRIKALSKPWNRMSEAEQRAVISGVEFDVRGAVRRVLEVFAADGRTTIAATLEQVVFKDGIKAVLTASAFDPNRHDLADATGKKVLVVVADVDAYDGEREPAEPDPDQGELPVEGDDEEPQAEAAE